MKGLIHQRDKIIINIHVPNFRTSKYEKQTLTQLKAKKKKKDSLIRLLGHFNISLSIMGRTIRENISKGRGDMNNNIN